MPLAGTHNWLRVSSQPWAERLGRFMVIVGVACLSAAPVLLAAPATPALAVSATTVPGLDTAVTYQIGVSHDGYSGDTTIVPPLSARWSHSFGGPVSYPLIADGMVFVTVSDNDGRFDTTLFALDQATGAIVWSQPISGTFNGSSSAAYDGGLVFDLNYDGLLRAFDASTGALQWSSQLPGQDAFTTPPSADSGVVYAAGSGFGGTAYAVSESTGAVLWAQPVENGSSSPALSDTDVYMSDACGQGPAYAFDRVTGQPQWTVGSGVCGNQNLTPVYNSGLLYTPDFDGAGGNEILDATTGALVGTFQANFPPAFDGDIGLFMNNGTLQAVEGGTSLWTFTGDGGLDGPPIAVGKTVYEGSSSGKLYGLNATTGQVVWNANEGYAIAGGLGAGQGLLVVPGNFNGGFQLTAYAAASHGAAVVTSTSLAASPAMAIVGTSVSLTATESAADGTTPVGTVQFEVGGTNIGAPVPVNASGVATTTTTFSAPGTEALAAVFTPASGTYAASEGTLSLVVNGTVTASTAGAIVVDVTVPATGSLTVAVMPGVVTLDEQGTTLPTTATGTLNEVTVTDTRNTYPGWTVSGQVSAFTSTGSTAASISGDQLGWTPTAVDPLVGVATLGPAVAPGTSPNGLADTAQVLASAPGGQGLGTNTLSASLTLDIPAATAAGAYSGRLTITYLETGPI